MHILNIKKAITLAVLITALLLAGACSGSTSDPIDGPIGGGNGSYGIVSGTLVALAIASIPIDTNRSTINIKPKSIFLLFGKTDLWIYQPMSLRCQYSPWPFL